MNDHETMERRTAHAEAFPRCPSCFRREGHSPNCDTKITESEKRLMDGNR